MTPDHTVVCQVEGRLSLSPSPSPLLTGLCRLPAGEPPLFKLSMS